MDDKHYQDDHHQNNDAKAGQQSLRTQPEDRHVVIAWFSRG